MLNGTGFCEPLQIHDRVDIKEERLVIKYERRLLLCLIDISPVYNVHGSGN